MTLLVNCLEYIYRAAGQDIIHGRSSKNLRIEIPRLLKQALANIEVNSAKSRFEAYYARPLEEPIDMQVISRSQSKGIPSLDMEVRFERGDGEFLSDNYQTNSNGQFSIKVTQINSKQEQQVIKASVDLTRFKAEIDKGSYLNGILRGIARANGKQVVLNVSEFRQDKVAVLTVGEGLSPVLLSLLMTKFNIEYKNQTNFDIIIQGS